MARLCEYRGGCPFYRLAIPSLFRLGCLGLIACVLCVAARPFLMPLSVPAASRSPLRPIRYDKRGGGSETAGRPAACYSWPSDGSVVRSRLVMAIMRPLQLLTPCVPRIARRRAALRIADALPFPHDVAARPF